MFCKERAWSSAQWCNTGGGSHQVHTTHARTLTYNGTTYEWQMCLLNIHVPQQRRLRGQLIEVFKYLNEFTNASARGLFDYDLNDRTRNNGAKHIEKHFNSSVAQHFYQIKITSTWNAPPSEVVSSRTVNSSKNSLDKHLTDNPPNVRVNW